MRRLRFNMITLAINQPKLTPEDEKKLMPTMRDKRVRE